MFLVHRLNSKWSKKENKKKNLNIQGNIETRRFLVKRAHVKFDNHRMTKILVNFLFPPGTGHKLHINLERFFFTMISYLSLRQTVRFSRKELTLSQY